MRASRLFPAVLLLVLLLAVSAAGGEAGFPVSVGGQELTLGRETRRSDLEAALRRALPKERPSVLVPQRIQYDVIAAEGQGPVSLAFDFDAQGRFCGATFDAMSKEQNPVAARLAARLAAWLTAEAGQGVRKGDDRVWTLAGFRFRLTEVKNAGEDSVYRLGVERQGK